MKSLKITVAIALAALFMAPVLNGCKKGDEDPGITIKSRKARLCKEWQISEAKKIEGIETEVVTGKSITLTEGTSAPVVGTIEWTVTFDKAGTFVENKSTSFTETVSGTSITTVTTTKNEGRWFFNDNNKEGDFKKGELLMIQITKFDETQKTTEVVGSVTTNSTSISSEVYSGKTVGAVRLIKLSGKELIIDGRMGYTLVNNQTWEKK